MPIGQYIYQLSALLSQLLSHFGLFFLLKSSLEMLNATIETMNRNKMTNTLKQCEQNGEGGGSEITKITELQKTWGHMTLKTVYFQNYTRLNKEKKSKKNSLCESS